jgi:GxxExxY protein
VGESWREEGEKDPLIRKIIGAAIEVHRALGPGLLESVYEACLMAEMEDRGIRFKSQVPLPVVFKGRRIEAGFRMDLVVENRVIVELKAIEKLMPIHEAQLLTYLKLSGFSTGLILNFNAPYLRDGIIRRVLT